MSQLDTCAGTWESHINVEKEVFKDVQKCLLLLIIELVEIVKLIIMAVSHMSVQVGKLILHTANQTPSLREYDVLFLERLVCFADDFQNVAGKHKMRVYEVVCEYVSRVKNSSNCKVKLSSSRFNEVAVSNQVLFNFLRLLEK